ncbi:P1 family peptidase [Paracoccus jiaweipingae]|uniref:P1 family peptidase n=1 Tax=unclassified Paracoccus (in: a-proteobacteria) TaxID=2688777 RepID=UPI00379EBD0C
MRPGPRNLITDIAGLSVGNAADPALKSGVTVLVGDAPLTCGVHVMGGAPGTRETDLLAPDKTVAGVDALVLSGGSAFGLEACSGVVDGLHRRGRGFAVGAARVPIVPGAIVFDLLNGGDKEWAANPYRDLGARALDAAGADFAIGSAGAGCGAMTGSLKGGLGSASAVMDCGITVGAVVVVNALGRACDRNGHFHAAPFEMGAEFGGLGPSPESLAGWEPLPEKPVGAATTIAIVATDARLDKAQATRMAVAAHDGMARALIPSHSPMDGDLVFAAATGAVAADPLALFRLGHVAACVLARAIARAVHAAQPAPGDLQPCWQQFYGPRI